MDFEAALQFIATQDARLESPSSYERIHSALAEQVGARLHELGPIESIFGNENTELSRYLADSGIQDGCSARNIQEVRELVNHLITDEGRLNPKALRKARDVIRQRCYRLGPKRRLDSLRHEHMLRVLKILDSSPSLVRQIDQITKPFSNIHADTLIRDTLGLPPKLPITDADATRAVLAAWLTYLRQNVGSCFATAPAIIVQGEQPERLMKDLSDLISGGELSRTVLGITYSVPLSPSWGAADLRRPITLSQNLTDSPDRIWLAPGIWRALQSVNLVERGIPMSEAARRVCECLKPVCEELAQGRPLFYSSCEDVLTELLRQQYGLSATDIKDFYERPRVMLSADIAVASKGGDPAGAKVEAFETGLAQAFNAFKSVTDNALLKAWEFTLASFAETKLELTRWNLYSSLGMRPEDEGGIGARLYQILKDRVDEANAEVAKQQELYDQVYYQAKHLEGRLRRAQDESQARWLKSEYTTHRNEAHTHIELRDKANRRAQRLSQLYDFLVDQYLDKMRGYFQEVYDADIRDVKGGPYDDSPAGFRLLCKHGRRNTSQWTLIDNPDEFANDLASFFVSVESEIVADPQLSDLSNDFSYITSNLVTHVKTKQFMETAFDRMAAAHKTPKVKNPLEHLDRVKKKPWVYTSGGTMASLVQCYFGGSDKPAEKEKWVESTDELLAFIIDVCRQLPRKLLELYFDEPHRSLLMHSPTHAFLLRPGSPMLREAIQSPVYAYTWIKENLTLDAQGFIRELRLDAEMTRSLIQTLSAYVPRDLISTFDTVFASTPGLLRLSEFREWMLGTLQRARGLSQVGLPVIRAEHIDSVLYSELPFCPAHKVKASLRSIWERLERFTAEELDLMERLVESQWSSRAAVSAAQLRRICLTLIMLVKSDVASDVDFPMEVIRAMQDLGLAMPRPFIFADTNWVNHHFAFLVNPGTGELDLWRVDYCGAVGEPMSHWKVWLDGTQKHPTWGIYFKPQDYR
ncbi:MAG: hypothetical protein KDK78_01460 [Chlamydiia bacterium]|nr:hypothetical protein [Chlamydiia bacterium]